MAQVFSHSFFAGTVPATFTTLATIDNAHVGVIRSVTAFGAAPALQPVNGIQLYVNGVLFVAQQSPYTRAGITYVWDMRVVAPPGSNIQGVAQDITFAVWQVTISGYLLTLP